MRVSLAAVGRNYTWRTARGDLAAALVVTAIAIPEGLGFAAIVGLPLQTGLYCALLGPVVYALLTSSRRLIVGADSATAALVAAGAAAVATVGTAEYGAAVALLGVVTGLLLVIMGYARLGFLADLISRPVLVGFLAGVGVQLMASKLPEMVGITTSGTPLQHLMQFVTQLGAINWVAAAIGGLVVVIAITMAGRTRVPSVLLSVIVAIIVAVVFSVEQYGVEVVGALPAGLPALTLPPFNLDMALVMLPAAFSIALVILAQSSATIRTFAAEHDDTVAPNRDLKALGAGNIASALTSGFAINGSPPRTMAADQAGGHTSLTNVYMAAMVAIVLLVGTRAFEHIPSAALAAVVFVIGLHLVRLEELKQIYRTRRTEFVIAMIALGGVALLGVRSGVMIAVLVSLMERLRRQYRPSDHVLLRDGKLSEWAQARLDPHHRHTSSPDGVLAYSFNGALFFENATYFEQRLRHAIRAAKHPVEAVVIDAGAIDDIDYTAATVLRRLYQQLHADDIRLTVAHVSPQLQALFDRFGITELIGRDHIVSTLKEAIQNQPHARRSIADMVRRLELDSEQYVVIGGGVMEALGLRRTHDADLVVSSSIYNQFRAKGWKEYIQDDGKRMLSRNGYHLMLNYMRHDVTGLRRDARKIDGINYMNPRRLIRAKQRMGREKDLADVALLEAYLASE